MNVLKLVFTLRSNLGRAFELARDVRVPLKLKLLALGAAIFILSPLNILGDIPLLGIVDDAALLALLLNWFVKAGSRHAAIVHPPATIVV